MDRPETEKQASFEEILSACVLLKKEKQSRYKRGDDPLSAFIESSGRANIPVLNLIFARIVDKEGRIANYLKDEVLDRRAMMEEFMDTINYSVFAIMALQKLVTPTAEAQDSDIPHTDPFRVRRIIKRVTEGNQDLSS